MIQTMALMAQSMKMLGISIWVFLNLTMLGLFVYVYLLWSVYWRMSATPRSPVLETAIQKGGPQGMSPWQQLNQFTSGGRPRYFWNDSLLLGRLAIPTDKLRTKIDTYRSQLIVKLRQSQLDTGSALNGGGALGGGDANPYNVQYHQAVGPPPASSVNDVSGMAMASSRTLLCDIRRTVKTRLVNKHTEPFHSLGIGNRFPPEAALEHLWDTVYYNTCAVVASSGSLYKSSLGKQIDSHDAVLRFNSAPTDGFEEDVGKKTTFRILNSQVVSKPEFQFLVSPLYKNITLFVWDPSNYTVDLEQWYQNPDFDLFTNYFKHRELYPKAKFYILHPQMLWDGWAFLQRHTAVPVMRHPPSSGFLGLLLMLHVCQTVDVYEYIPSMRLTKRCHYFDVHENMACTFGAWHPLSSEKLLALAMNSGSDEDVFVTGKIRVMGIASMDCDHNS